MCDTTEDRKVYGDVWVYCSQHLRPHETGWCTVHPNEKFPLEARSYKEAKAECERKGYKLFKY